jgi:hypothetical protein
MNLSKVVRQVNAHVKDVPLNPSPTSDEARKRALGILSHIAALSPTHRAVIAAEVKAALVVRLVDQQIARDVELQLVGALLQDTSLGTPTARQYDRVWMSTVTGHDFQQSSPLDESVTRTCDAQVADQLPTTFASRDCAARHATQRILDDFLQSSSTVFIMSGRSGTGKSWALYDWATRVLAGRIRLLTSGLRVTDQSTLQSHIANALRQFSSQTLPDSALFTKFTQPAGSNLGPPILIIDDLRPSIDRPADYARGIARLVDDARRTGVKLVISCQSDLSRSLRPFRDVSPGLVFRAEGRAVSNDEQLIESFSVSDFTDDELRDAIHRALQPNVTDSVYSRMRDPFYAHLRHPYSLGALLSELGGCKDSEILQTIDGAVVSVLDKRIDTKLAQASRHASLEISELREVVNEVMRLKWQNHDAESSRMMLTKAVHTTFGDLGTTALDALQVCGLFLSGPVVAFAEAPLGARLMARWLHTTGQSFGDVGGKLRWELDHELVAQLVATADDPVRFGAQFVHRSDEWIPAVAEGLMLGDPEDSRVVALFVAMARREHNGWSAADAFGRYSLRSQVARKDLLKRLVSVNDDDRGLAGRALWTVGPLAPDQAVRAVRAYFRLAARRFKELKHELGKLKDLRSLRQQAARALGILGSIDGRHAGELVLSFLPTLRPLIDDSNIPIRQDEVAFIRTDPLVENFDQIDALASVHADKPRFAQILAALKSPDVATRLHAVNGLFLVSRNLPGAIHDSLLNRLSAEQYSPILADLLWSSYGVAKREPSAVLTALEKNQTHLFIDYEPAGAALSLLEALGNTDASRVHALIPTSFAHLPSEPQALLVELLIATRIRCEGAG